MPAPLAMARRPGRGRRQRQYGVQRAESTPRNVNLLYSCNYTYSLGPEKPLQRPPTKTENHRRPCRRYSELGVTSCEQRHLSCTHVPGVRQYALRGMSSLEAGGTAHAYEYGASSIAPAHGNGTGANQLDEISICATAGTTGVCRPILRNRYPPCTPLSSRTVADSMRLILLSTCLLNPIARSA
ncbi:hypothetical protein BV20DRAFT_549435 [Pilatotrama ljubarskyi]|nr:hypothetical protein BV20DRAFT_549435 [Pilatotrama ljubarskyi]